MVVATGGGLQIDAAVAWGGEAEIRRRISEHLEAGATQIAISPLNPEDRGPDWSLLEALAP